MVADLTAGNKNVYHEVGLLTGLNQVRQKGHDNFLLLHNSSGGETGEKTGGDILWTDLSAANHNRLHMNIWR